LISSVDTMGRLGTMMPGLANRLINAAWVRKLNERFLGLAAERPLPPYASQRFDRWFAAHKPSSTGTRGRVILWDDTFVRYHEPHIGHAAVAVLEAAGYAVDLVHGRQCCGRPAFSVGCLDIARAYGTHNLGILKSSSDPIIFLEP